MDDRENFSSEDQDPIIKEIPIFLSKRLEDQLYVFQYPLKPKYTKDEMDVRKCFFKPKNQEIKLEVGLNVTSNNFDIGKAEYLAHEIEKNQETKKEQLPLFENEIVDKVVYNSRKTVCESCKYAVGVFNGKEYHVTPLKGFLQLRPDFSHLDKALKRKRDNQDDDSDEDYEPGPSKVEQVTVKFARNETEQAKKARESSYKRLKEKSEEEPWMECCWKDSRSIESEIEMQKLFAENTTNNEDSMNLSNSEYIRILVPEDQEQATIKPSLPSNVVSFHALGALPLQERCKHLLKDAKIIQFQQLMLLLAGGEGLTPDALLKALSQVAVLVRGNWVVKSEILYPTGTFSAISGVPAESMCRSRDYILFLFTKHQYVERKKISCILKIPNEEIKEILTGISKLRHNKGWELLQNRDVDFIMSHPDIVQRYELLWEQKAKQLEEFLKDGREKTKRRKSKSVSEDAKTKKDYYSSENDSGTERSNKSPRMGR